MCGVIILLSSIVNVIVVIIQNYFTIRCFSFFLHLEPLSALCRRGGAQAATHSRIRKCWKIIYLWRKVERTACVDRRCRLRPSDETSAWMDTCFSPCAVVGRRHGNHKREVGTYETWNLSRRRLWQYTYMCSDSCRMSPRNTTTATTTSLHNTIAATSQ